MNTRADGDATATIAVAGI
uniref:Uncharacterized protein n=1 Tax=Arundo donax TaxID=35708 RepID=A0A0A8XXG4_ARUDO